MEVYPLPRAAVRAIFLKIAGDHHKRDPRLNEVLALADGMPLAAELLGGVVREHDTLAKFLTAWQASGVALLDTASGGKRSASIRRTVAFSLDHSRLKDNAKARRLLRLLADLPDGLFRDDLQAAFPELDAEALPTLGGVGGLLRVGEDRLTMLAPIREELRQLLSRDDADWQHAIGYFARWAQTNGNAFRWQHDANALARFRETQQNLELLLREGLHRKIAETASGICALGDFGYRLGIDYHPLLSDAAALATEQNDPLTAAFAWGQIADVLQQRGQTDEALRIRREEELPVYERLGDVHAKAVTLGKIANVLKKRGQTDEALRIRREEELPVYERLGDVHAKLICRAKIGRDLILRGNASDCPEARAHLEWALAEARRLQLPEAVVIEGYLKRLEEE